MDLVLWRHAEAYDLAEPDADDMARELTPRGLKQAARMAGWLDRQLPESTKILVSPAVRAEQTAAALQRKYKTRQQLQPSSDLLQLLEVVHRSDNENTLLLVGHQPALGALAAYFLDCKLDSFTIRKGAVWWLRTRQRDAMNQTVLVCVQTPEYL
jgi:phosphohistidine phosphatase